MFKHFLIRDLRYRHPKRPDPIGDQKKAFRSANSWALQVRGKSRASSSTEAQGENQFSALDQETESNEEEDDLHSDAESAPAAVVTRFILDSGSTYDIMNKKEVPKQQPAVPLPRSEPVARASGANIRQIRS